MGIRDTDSKRLLKEFGFNLSISEIIEIRRAIKSDSLFEIAKVNTSESTFK